MRSAIATLQTDVSNFIMYGYVYVYSNYALSPLLMCAYEQLYNIYLDTVIPEINAVSYECELCE